MRITFLLILFFFFIPALNAQQVPDTNYTFKIENPAYPQNNGPVIMVDSFHNNFHNIDERYKPFAKVLKEDGYKLL